MEIPELATVSQLLETILDVLRDPAADPRASVLVFAAVAMLLLIVVAFALIFILGGDDDEEDDGEAEAPQKLVRVPRQKPPREPLPPWVMWRNAGISVAAFALVWVVAGVSTADRALCLSCHQDSSHEAAAAIDPHTSVRCVSCHEAGNRLTLAAFTLPERIQHIVVGQAGSPLALEYGHPVSSIECARCHAGDLGVVLHDEVTGVSMSHAEPLEAGAECVDCHALESGVVSDHNVGMVPCLRCHDNEVASAECETCHLGDPAQAIRSTEPTAGSFASALVPRPGCDSCHDQATEGCDACHGLRLPHADEFRAYAHARPGVEDIWDNDGKLCGQCHYQGRRDCTRCHEQMPSHGLWWKDAHYVGDDFNAPCACHQDKAWTPGRSFCGLCHDVSGASAAP